MPTNPLDLRNPTILISHLLYIFGNFCIAATTLLLKYGFGINSALGGKRLGSAGRDDDMHWWPSVVDEGGELSTIHGARMLMSVKTKWSVKTR